jgi:hypothetical protein
VLVFPIDRFSCLRENTAERDIPYKRYDHRTRASQASLLGILYDEVTEGDEEHYQSRIVYPVLDLSLMDRLEYGIFLDDIEKETYWNYTFPQTYLKPRFDDLMGAYKSGRIPSEWRLVAGIFPPVGDEDELHLTVLLKPVEHGLGFKTAYCASRYR